jgi:hypothetical protein
MVDNLIMNSNPGRYVTPKRHDLFRGLGSGQLAGAAAGSAAGAATGAATAAATAGAAAGPSIQLNRSVLNRMKWINRARTNRNIAKATNVLRGSNINQSLHMIPPP